MKKFFYFLVLMCATWGVTQAQDISSRTPGVNAVNVRVNADDASVVFSRGSLDNSLNNSLNNGVTIKDAAGNNVRRGNISRAGRNGSSARTLDIPYSELSYGTTYTVTIPAADYGIRVNPAIVWSFTTESGIVSRTPTVDATSVPLEAGNATIVFTTNRQSNTSLSNANAKITIKDPADNNVRTGDLSWVSTSAWDIFLGSVETRTLRIPYSALQENTKYTVVIEGGSISGFSNNIEWSFTTLYAPRTVASYIPAVNATNVAVDATVSATFNLPIEVNEGIASAISIVNTVDADNTITVTPAADATDNKMLNIGHSPFTAGTAYTVNIPAGAVKELRNAFTWSFTTVGPANPAIVPEGALPANMPVTVDFDLPVALGAGDITVTNTTDNQQVTVTPSIDAAGNLVLTPEDGFIAGTGYTVHISANAVRGCEAANLDFTTAAPIIAIHDPAVGGLYDTESRALTLTFNENIAAGDLSGIAITPAGSTLTPTVAGKILTIAHDALTDGVVYTVNVPAGAVRGFTGLPAEWTFTVMMSPPVLKTEDVRRETDIVLEFAAAVSTPNDFAGITFEPGNIAGTATIGADGKTLTVSHVDPFEYGTTYTVHIPQGTIVGFENDYVSDEFSIAPAPVFLGFSHDAALITADRLSESIVLTFDDLIDIKDNSGINLTAAGGSSVAITLASVVDKTKLSIAHSALARGTTYTLNIAAGAIGSYAGSSWSFTTEAFALPAQDNRYNVGIDGAIEIAFDGAIVRGSNFYGIEIRRGGVAVSGVTPSISGSNLVLNYTGLARGTVYTVYIPANAINGQETEYDNALTFTTVPLKVTSQTPAPDAAYVETQSEVYIEFDDEVIASSSFAGITLNGNPLTKDNFSVLGNRLTFSRELFDTYGEDYTVIIPMAAINGLLEDITWNFSTRVPRFTDRTPNPYRTGIAITEPIKVVFPANSNIQLGANSANIAITPAVTNMSVAVSGDELIINHDNFQPNTEYAVTIPQDAVKGLSEYEANAITNGWTFFTISGTPGTKIPYEGQEDVPVNTPITIEFDVQVSIANLAGITLSLDDEVISNVANIGGNGMLLNITYPAPLVKGKTYKVTIADGAISGIAPGAISWEFTTEAPSILETTPGSADTDVPVSADVVITYDDVITEGHLFNIDNISIEPYPGNVEMKIDGNKLVISHDNFIFGVAHTITVNPGVINGYKTLKTWTFTTASLTSESKSPEIGAIGIAVDAEPSVVFNEVPVLNSGNAGVSIVPSAGSVYAVADEKTIRIMHSVPFETGTLYTVTLDKNAIRDYKGGDDIIWTFTTVNPAETARTPQNGATDVAFAAEVSMTFDREIYSDNLSGITITPALLQGAIIPSISPDRRTLTVTHPNFSAGTLYTVTIPVGALRGVGEKKWSFTTESIKVAAKTPPEGATNILLNAPVSVTFETSNVSKGTGEVSFSPEVTGIHSELSGDVLTIAHADFKPGTEYTVTVGANTVLGLNEDLIWTFTTDAPDVTNRTPLNNATNVALNAPVSLDFDMDITKSVGAVVSISPAVSNVNYFTEGRKLIIVHDAFVPGTTYTVTVPVGTLVGQHEEISWQFTTGGSITNVGEMNKFDVKLYPNPVKAASEVTIQIGENDAPMILEMYNPAGILLQKIETGNSIIKLTAPNEQGVYLLRLVKGGKIATYKLVVQ